METDVWTVKRILDWIETYLQEHGDAHARLSAQWLVSEALHISRVQLFMDAERPLTLEERAVLRDYTRRRALGEPLQYITGTTDFRFATIKLARGVLIPRPETEVLVSEALAELDALREVKRQRRLQAMLAETSFEDEAAAGTGLKSGAHDVSDSGDNNRGDGEDYGKGSGEDSDSSIEYVAEVSESAPKDLRVLDLCTGSGCIAVSIATEVPHSYVLAADIDPKCVELTKINVQDSGVDTRVDVYLSDLGEDIPFDESSPFDLLISNPPYIPTKILGDLDKEVTEFESSLALDGGEDGLDIFRRILPYAWRVLAHDGVLALELHETCLGQAAQEAQDYGFEHVRIANDLAGRPRVLIARKG